MPGWATEDNDEFVKGSSGEAMVTLTAQADALGIRVTSDIAKNATANQVDVGKDTIGCSLPHNWLMKHPTATTMLCEMLMLLRRKA